jgi:hypothetical protein
MFQLFQMYVASVLFGCCIYCNGHVASVCFKRFICFRRMLQVFYLDVPSALVAIQRGKFTPGPLTWHQVLVRSPFFKSVTFGSQNLSRASPGVQTGLAPICLRTWRPNWCRRGSWVKERRGPLPLLVLLRSHDADQILVEFVAGSSSAGRIHRSPHSRGFSSEGRTAGESDGRR